MDLLLEELVDKIIINLKILSSIQVNEKLCIRKGNLQIDKESNLRPFKRWLCRDTTDNVLSFIKDIFRKIQCVNDNKDLLRIYTEFEKTEIGFENLKITYSYNPVTVATIDNLIVKLRELRKE